MRAFSRTLLPGLQLRTLSICSSTSSISLFRVLAYTHLLCLILALNEASPAQSHGFSECNSPSVKPDDGICIVLRYLMNDGFMRTLRTTWVDLLAPTALQVGLRNLRLLHRDAVQIEDGQADEHAVPQLPKIILVLAV